MADTQTSSNTTDRVEFSSGYDSFGWARKIGPKAWIVSHFLTVKNLLLLLFTFFLVTISSFISLMMMIVIGQAISDFLFGNVSTLLVYTFIILIMAISSPLLTLSSNIMREILAQRMERDTRKEFYVNLLGKSQSFHDLQRIGDIMARATNDVRMLNYLISPALSLIFDAIVNLIAPIIVISLFLPTQLVFTPLIFIILFIPSLYSYIKKMDPVTSRLQQEFGQINAILNESLSGIEVAKSSTQELREIEKYFKNAKNYRDAYVDYGKILAKYLPLLFVALTITLGVAHTIILNFLGMMDVGQIIAYIGILTRLRFPAFISIFSFAIVRLAIAGAKRLLEIMNKKTEIDENVKGITREIEGSIKFEKVTFAYPHTEKVVLRDISFEISAGQTIAIVGTTGSGKSTLTKLLSRLYDVADGQILIDGINIQDYSLRSLRDQISYIEQDIFLFSSTVFENITFGRTSSKEDAIRVAQQAQAHDFIMSLPKAYDTEVGERGVQLSGGERQRIAMARSFLTDPAILILDDSTSAIDSETEDKIQRAIHKIQQGRTTFIITHRLSQIRWADLILVLERGEIIAKGTHEELLRTSDEYRKIFVKKFDIEGSKVTEECV